MTMMNFVVYLYYGGDQIRDHRDGVADDDGRDDGDDVVNGEDQVDNGNQVDIENLGNILVLTEDRFLAQAGDDLETDPMERVAVQETEPMVASKVGGVMVKLDDIVALPKSHTHKLYVHLHCMEHRGNHDRDVPCQ